MQAMVLNWRRLKNKDIQDLCIKLRYSLENYETPISLMSGSIEIVHLNDRDNIKEWAKQVLEVSSVLRGVVYFCRITCMLHFTDTGFFDFLKSFMPYILLILIFCLVKTRIIQFLHFYFV